MSYIHGYSERESERLLDQSLILKELLHGGTSFLPGEKVLEAGCGVGAQTISLAENNPQTLFSAVDISQDSLAKAEARCQTLGLSNVEFTPADILNLPFSEEEFDHAFICFVLEHLDCPKRALSSLHRVIKPGGSLTVIEGDHGSCFWHPRSEASSRVWQCLVNSQAKLGHNGLIGRELYPLLQGSAYQVKDVSPRWVYADAGSPQLLDGVVNKIIVPMVETARSSSLELGMIDEMSWQKGLSDLRKSGETPEGSFFYTWFKALAVRTE